MSQPAYSGRYHRFTVPDKKLAAYLLGADGLIGDELSLEFSKEQVGIRNRFGVRIAEIDGESAHELLVAHARRWLIRPLLASVLFTEEPRPGHFWGEVACICYPESLAQELEPFVTEAKRLLADGVRPSIDLTYDGLEKLRESDGTWFPSGREAAPQTGNGTVLLKSRRSLKERFIEKIRERNLVAMIGGWVALLAVVTVIVLVVRAFV